MYRLAQLTEDGDQFVFPVYEPDPDALRAKLIAAQEEERSSHYDASKEGEQAGMCANSYSSESARGWPLSILAGRCKARRTDGLSQGRST